MKSAEIKCLVVAGEVSGDIYAAGLIEALRKLSPRPWSFQGIGGDAMRQAGANLFYHTDQMGVMGVWEVAQRLPLLRRAFRDMSKQLERNPPDLLLTVDYPGFNLPLARRANKLGIPAVHYICPKVWAWKRGRVPRIARSLDHLLTVFPFEPPLFDGTGLKVSFVGHPLVDLIAGTRAENPPPLPWGPGRRLALLPGSRSTEIERLLPLMLATASLVERQSGPVSSLIPAPNASIAALARRIMSCAAECPVSVQVVEGYSRHVMQQADAALVASGTATLEACLLRCPTLIVYRVAPFTHALGRLLVKGVRHIGLPNIIAGKTVCPELIQDDFTPERALRHLLPLLEDGFERNKMLAQMDAVNATLGESRAHMSAARAVLSTPGLAGKSQSAAEINQKQR